MNACESKDSGEVIKNHHKQAFEYISKALRIDEDDTGEKEQAVQWYKRGIAELERGIAVELTRGGDQYERARRLQDKMVTNLSMAKDRLALLGRSSLYSFSQCLFSESTLESKRSSLPRQTSNHVLPQAKAVPKSQPAARGAATNRALPTVRHASKFTDSKVSPQAGKDQNGKTSAVKPPRRDMKNFKNVDSKLANLILNEIVDRYLEISFQVDIFTSLRLLLKTFLGTIPRSGASVSFEDIAGQELAKQALQEIVILPPYGQSCLRVSGLRRVACCCLGLQEMGKQCWCVLCESWIYRTAFQSF
ncbi:unnamed protein product [Tetraodon nigroviridis]|uniref:(spotted green pufferfish) hypothetical protein n=1 Tax=Tetraodon nigroviridis TaxID=99883 RepID=Q4TCD9_TETNG|nr:unnamed protein product [Tetraodon nigroviridis]